MTPRMLFSSHHPEISNPSLLHPNQIAFFTKIMTIIMFISKMATFTIIMMTMIVSEDDCYAGWHVIRQGSRLRNAISSKTIARRVRPLIVCYDLATVYLYTCVFVYLYLFICICVFVFSSSPKLVHVFIEGCILVTAYLYLCISINLFVFVVLILPSNAIFSKNIARVHNMATFNYLL